MVSKVEHVESKQTAAAKIIPSTCDEEIVEFIVEVDILTECRHPHIVGLVKAYFWENKFWILLELCTGGALDDVFIELVTPLSF